MAWIGGGTKSGKTRGAAAWLVTRALRAPGMYWWVAPWSGSARRGFRELRRVARPLIQAGYCRVKNHVQMLIFANGAVIECHTGENPDGLYGDAVSAAVVDEATRCRPEVQEAIESVTTPPLSDGGQAPVRWLFNVDRGRRHWAIRNFVLAKSLADQRDTEDGYSGRTADGSLAYYHFPTSANPYIKKDRIERARKRLPDRSFRALYLAEIQEDGAGVFAERAVERACIVDRQAADAAPDPNGRYVIGVDLAKKQDFTVAIVLETRLRRVVDWLRFNERDYTVQVQQVAALAKRYRAGCVIETNGPGEPIYDYLVKLRTRAIPFPMTQEAKHDVISGLIVSLEGSNLFLPKAEEFPELKEELLQFEYEYSRSGKLKYSAPAGFHDDTVIALALANWGAAKAGRPFRSATDGTDGSRMEDEWRRAF